MPPAKKPAQVKATRPMSSAPATKRRKLSESVAAVASSSGTQTTTETTKEAEEEELPRKRVSVTEELDNLERDTLEPSWQEAVNKEFSKPYFKQLKEFLAGELKTQRVFPSLSNVYSWSRLTPLANVKAVVIGQDPYHDVNQAHGLSFSVLSPTKPPPSLRNIYKQIANDIPSFKVPTSGDLSPVAENGVLWLNTSLTVRAHKAGSHSGKGWETFTAAVLKAVTNRSDGLGVVFFVWGKPAEKMCKTIGIDEKKHLVLKSAHPSPLSANRGFIGNEHFKKANEWLVKTHGPGSEIDWTVLNKK